MAVRKMQSQRAERTALLDLEQPDGFASGGEYPMEYPAAVPGVAAEHERAGVNTAAPVRRRRRKAHRFALDSRWSWIALGLGLAIFTGAAAFAFLQCRAWLLRSPYFRLGPSGTVAVSGNRIVPSQQIWNFFSDDAGRSVYRVPLAERRSQIEALPWVQRASVMRLWPNQIGVHITERTPVAFVRDGASIRMIDAQGVLLDLPGAAAQHYSFPVLTGISASDPQPIRAARVGLYQQFAAALDAKGGHISSKLDQVDISDPEDIRATFIGAGREPLVHLGSSHYLARYEAFQDHLSSWLQEYPHLRSVDMRYGREVILDTGNVARNATIAPGPMTASPSIPVKPAAGHAPALHPKTTPPVHPVATQTRAHPVHTQRHKTRHTPEHKERGHTVIHPLMHVVSGV
jgi:cell division protein FtsQ